MQPIEGHSSWRVSSSVAAIPLMAVAMIALTGLAAEVVVRSSVLRTRIPLPSVGVPSRLVDQHIHQMEELERNGADLDCVIVGNSLPLLGTEPDVLAAAFAERTGKRLSCYDFGVPGVRADGAAVFARVFSEDYSPWLLIYATSARDFVVDEDGIRIETVPWLQYRAGELAPEGWLVDHSDAYRYYLTYRIWSEPNRRRFVNYRFPTTKRGFLNTRTGFKMDLDAFAPQIKAPLIERLAKGVSEAQFDGLRRLLELHQPSRQVVILEMPGAPALGNSLGDEVPNYDAIVDRMRSEAARSGVPYWRLTEAGVIPDNGWVDLWHMNRRGAAGFSRWLAGRIADALASGELVRPRP